MSVHPIVGFLSITFVLLKQIIWNFVIRLRTITWWPSLILDFTIFSVLELFPIYFSWKWGTFVSYGHVLPFFCATSLSYLLIDLYTWTSLDQRGLRLELQSFTGFTGATLKHYFMQIQPFIIGIRIYFFKTIWNFCFTI